MTEHEDFISHQNIQRPLISFYVITCNQEKFITEAVAGALAQTWSPLEVVLSDDFSDDATFEIMKSIACVYKGPHSIVINRNEKRLGVGAHINRILRLCSGDWIVASAGDDVSVPERTEKLYEHWVAHGRKAALVYSNIIEINECGSILYELDFRKKVPGGWPYEELQWDYRERLAQKSPSVHGAAFAYPRRTFDDFGDLWEGVCFEDGVLPWRAEISGGVLLCSDYLVRHRNHSQQLTNIYSKQALKEAGVRRRMLKWSRVQTRKQNLYDAKTALDKGLIPIDVYKNAENVFGEMLNHAKLEFTFQWGSFKERWLVLFGNFNDIVRQSKKTEILFALLPRPLYLTFLRFLANWKK